MQQKRKFFLRVVYLFIDLPRDDLLVAPFQCLWYSARNFNNYKIMTGASIELIIITVAKEVQISNFLKRKTC